MRQGVPIVRRREEYITAKRKKKQFPVINMYLHMYNFGVYKKFYICQCLSIFPLVCGQGQRKVKCVSSVLEQPEEKDEWAERIEDSRKLGISSKT